jgi:hypothetical protein
LVFASGVRQRKWLVASDSGKRVFDRLRQRISRAYNRKVSIKDVLLFFTR